VPQHSQSDQGRLRTHRVTQGLFILRYVSSNAGVPAAQAAAAPSIKVSSHNAKDVELIAWPGASANELLGPGDGVVLRVSRDTTIALEVIPSRAGGSVDAELHLEPVSRLAHGGFSRSNNVASAVGRVTAEMEVDGIEILAHVSRRGDVVIPAGEWICGPEYPMAIEGIEIRWPHRPRGLEITTNVSVSKNGLRNLPAAQTGTFAGTRGRAAPITGIELSLAGARARDFVLHSDALFLGSAVQSKRGRSISLSGPSGREPLVGLRLSIDGASSADAAQAASAASIEELPKSRSNWSSGGRVRVFRGLKQREGTSPNPIRNRA
jgi:hypothetical protein